MLAYWVMFCLPLIGVISPQRLSHAQARIMFLFVCAIMVVLMGLRHEVGGDWVSYFPMFLDISELDLASVMELSDPGYKVLNWLVAQIGGNIYLVDVICATIMMVGVFRFCRSMPNPWLALLVAVPYMLNIVGMGYTRQAVALGLVMAGLVSLGKGRTLSFVVLVVFGALFHKSASLLIPIAGMAIGRQRIWTAFWVAVAFVLAYFVLLQSETETLWKNYVTLQMQSQGALVRVLMNVVAAILLLLFRRQLVKDPQERRLWTLFAVLAIVCLPLVSYASTAVDRMALYLLPLQLFVFSRLPVLARSVNGRTLIVVGAVLYYAAVEFVWLNYAVERQFWVPYHFMPL